MPNIFDIPKVVNLVLPDSSVGLNGRIHMNYQMSRQDFRLVRGITNIIQFFIRDVDRQSIVTTGMTFTITITDLEGTVLLLQRDLVVQDASQALFVLNVSDSDMLDWNNGPLKYSVLAVSAAIVVPDVIVLPITLPNGDMTPGSSTAGYTIPSVTRLLWVNQDYGPYGTLVVEDGPIPGPVLPVTLDPNAFITVDGWSYSSALKGSAQLGYHDGTQTTAVYSTDFSGSVRIQGSLTAQPSVDPNDWFEIVRRDFSQTTGVTAINTQGNYVWMRILVSVSEVVLTPFPDPPIVLNGSVDKILFKN